MEPKPKPLDNKDIHIRHASTELKPIYGDHDPSLEELGIEFHDPAEGMIDYTTQPQAIEQWFQNEFSASPQQRGEAVLKLCEEYLGIDRDTMLACPALEDYWKHVKDGRFIGTVAMQYNNPTPYYLTNVLNLAQIHNASGGKMPVSFMTMEYPEDYFSFKNGDKTGAAFNGLNIPYSVNGNGEVGYVRRELNPTAILRPPQLVGKKQEVIGEHDNQMIAALSPLRKQPDGTVSRKAKETHDSQYYKARCNEVLFDHDEELFEELGIQNYFEDPDKIIVAQNSNSNNQLIRSTDFYKALWDRSLNDLRANGNLPSEQEMPFFTVNGYDLYSYMAQHAKPTPQFLEAHGWDSLPVRNDGVMYGAAYYLVQPRWASVYHECSSCMCLHDPNMHHALPIHDQLREHAGVGSVEVRLPDIELASAHIETSTVVGQPAFEPGFKAYMRSLDESLQDPSVQEVFSKL